MQKTKYTTGDWVLVKPDLTSVNSEGRVILYGMDYDPNARQQVTPGMTKFAGKFVKITYLSICECGMCYEIEQDHGEYLWTDEMFVDLNGKFGNTTAGDVFVIVEQKLIYEAGLVDQLSEGLIYGNSNHEYTIERICDDCQCFAAYNENRSKLYSTIKTYTYDQLRKIVGHDFKLVDKS